MRIRDIQLSDQAQVNALWESVWWPTRSASGWDWLARNPAMQASGAPLGWVIEDGAGDLAAVLGALPMRFWRGGDSVLGLSGHSLVVTPRWRGSSRLLIERIIAQPAIALCYTLNANVLSHRLYGRFGFVTPPGAAADQKLSWTLDPLACLAARGLRRALEFRPALARRLGEQLQPGARLWREDATPFPDFITEIRPDQAYADFWERLRAESDWLADRSPEIWRWRLADPDQTTAPLMLGYVRGGELLAYACAMFAKENPIEPVALEIIDLQALVGAPEAIERLMTALMRIARQRGAAKLRLTMYGPQLYQRLGRYGQIARREGGWTHAHVRLQAHEPDLSLWSPTPFDGDLFMTLRPPPVSAAAPLRHSA